MVDMQGTFALKSLVVTLPLRASSSNVSKISQLPAAKALPTLTGLWLAVPMPH